MYHDDELIDNEFLVDVRGYYVSRAIVRTAIVTGYFAVHEIVKEYNPSQVGVYDHHGRDVTYKFVSNVL